MEQINENELRELEIDTAREQFEESCVDFVASLAGWDSIMSKEAWRFDYDDVCYLNAYTNSCWQSYIKGRQFSAGSKRI